jgi:hypothetical protein
LDIPRFLNMEPQGENNLMPIWSYQSFTSSLYQLC